jgi:hypothetical protein
MELSVESLVFAEFLLGLGLGNKHDLVGGVRSKNREHALEVLSECL